jgi:UDP-N-acetylglucosamine--N-acetylmuramyl-(pentapeptide) pyrophosphoryl-undecaprenol N-acetylglucosamine transferase
MIGYYAHHRGFGHLSRAAAVAQCLDEPVTLLSTAAVPKPSAFFDTVELADDAPGEVSCDDPTAHGQLHWAPYHHRGLQRRMSQVARWVELARPSVVVVDVSVEVTTLVRLLGVPVVVLAMPGNRTDLAHQCGYRLADQIIAPWTQQVYDPPWLWPFQERVHYVGSFSRFDGEPSRPPRPGTPRHGLVFGGTGGTTLTPTALKQLAVGQPKLSWDVVGAGSNWVDDVWPRLCAADVVVSHAGQNAVAEIAAARRPAVLVAEPRPHDEQLHTGRALASAGIVRLAATWEDVGVALSASLADPVRWELWAPPRAAETAALAVQQAAAAGGR